MLRQRPLDRYVALLVATIVWLDLPHRYHRGRPVTPGSSRISKSNSLAQGALCIPPQPDSTYKRSPCSSNAMRSIFHVCQYNVRSLSRRYISTSPSRTTSSSSPNCDNFPRLPKLAVPTPSGAFQVIGGGSPPLEAAVRNRSVPAVQGVC